MENKQNMGGSNPSQGGDNPGQKRPGSEGTGDQRTFRCADVGFADCRWEVSGRTEDELMPKIEQHGREKHGMSQLDDNTRNKVRDAIRTRAA
jgi:predicted small metal-binding protein